MGARRRRSRSRCRSRCRCRHSRRSQSSSSFVILSAAAAGTATTTRTHQATAAAVLCCLLLFSSSSSSSGGSTTTAVEAAATAFLRPPHPLSSPSSSSSRPQQQDPHGSPTFSRRTIAPLAIDRREQPEDRQGAGRPSRERESSSSLGSIGDAKSGERRLDGYEGAARQQERHHHRNDDDDGVGRTSRSVDSRLQRLQGLRRVVDRAVKAFFAEAHRRQSLWLRVTRTWAATALLVLSFLCGGAIVPSPAFATTSAPGTVISRADPSKQQRQQAQHPSTLVAKANNNKAAGTSTASIGARIRAFPSSPISTMSDEHQRGLETLKRNLLREGIDPNHDWEGQRQVHFYKTGIDLATSPLGPWPGSSSWGAGGPAAEAAGADGSASSAARQFVTKQLERAQWQYAPQTMANKVRHQRQLLSCVVHDLEARGIDPLQYLERHPQWVQRILQLSNADAEHLATLYRRNLVRYGRIMSSQIRFANSFERHLLAPVSAKWQKDAARVPPPPFQEYLLPSAHAPSAAVHRSTTAPDWFDDSDAKAAADAQRQEGCSASMSTKKRPHGRKKKFKTGRTRTAATTTTTTTTEAPSSALTSVPSASASASTLSPTSSLVGTIRRRFLVPAVGLIVIGAAALQVTGGAGGDEGDGTEGEGADASALSERDLDFQRLYTLLTGDVRSYKDRLQPTQSANETRDEPSATIPTKPSAVEPSTVTADATSSATADRQDKPSGEAISSSATSLFARWMPHRRYSQETEVPRPSAGTAEQPFEASQQSAVDSDENNTVQSRALEPRDGEAATASPPVDSKTRLLTDALVMSRSMSVAELATMRIPASPPSAGTPQSQPRDLFDFLSTIEDERTNEFARQLAKLLALGAPAEFFWHVHSLSGGTLPVDVTSRGVDSVQRFLNEARTTAGIEPVAARQLFDDVKRCMMTDMMEFESKLLQGSTTADAIHHVVDFMAHVSTVHDALLLSCTSAVPSVVPSPNTADAASVSLPSQGVEDPTSGLDGTEAVVSDDSSPIEPDELVAPVGPPLSNSTAGPLEAGASISSDASTNVDSRVAASIPSNASSFGATSARPAESLSGISTLEASSLATSPPPPSPPSPPSSPSAMDPSVRPTYNESYTSLRSFLENIHDTYSGTGGLY